MRKPSIRFKKRLIFMAVVIPLYFCLLIYRLIWIQIYQTEFYQKLAYDQQTRQRMITPTRGSIVDRNGKVVAKSATVSTIWIRPTLVPKDQKQKVAQILAKTIGIEYDTVYKKVSKTVALEKIKEKVDPKIANQIREFNLPGVRIDDDSKRYYPYQTLGSFFIGFVGKDNQGIIGLEAKYEQYLKGIPGIVREETDARGNKFKNSAENRQDPIPGYTLQTTIDLNVQQLLEQELERAYTDNLAKRTTGIVMDPRDGSILAYGQYPNYDLNTPFKNPNAEIQKIWEKLDQKQLAKEWNQMWRNFGINDTYEPGSTFKIITTASGLESGAVTPETRFHCVGFSIVEDRRIKCWYFPRAHGSENLIEGVQNSCNPVFIEIASRMGPEKYFEYLKNFGLREKTGIDIAGEATGILHNVKNVGPVELATTSFGQSIQITPIQLMRGAAATINGGSLVTPHFAKALMDEQGKVEKTFEWPLGRKVVSKQTSDTMRNVLESVVAEGTGHKAYVPGMRIGGKTATAEKLPRGSGKRIASFLGFAPAENPQVMALIIIDEPSGPIKYGGQIAAPIVGRFFKNLLPYLGVKPQYNEEELAMEGNKEVVIPNLTGKNIEEASKILKDLKLSIIVEGEGSLILDQFPTPNEKVRETSKVMLFTTEQ